MSGRHGLLIVDKPRGFTSHDIVAQARRVFAERAVGHAGTLDPLATGVLVLLFGEACKLSGYLTAQDKIYQATVTFGVSTDSLDADGRILEERLLSAAFPDPVELERALALERARTLQIPPAVSAIHDQGERAHVRARRGEAVELPARAVELIQLEVLKLEGHALSLEVRASKGYYVRALARDLGLSLGVPAHLSALRRCASGPFTLAEAVSWPPASLPALVPLAAAAERALPVTRLLTDEAVVWARQGKRLGAQHAAASRCDQLSAWLAPAGDLVAIGLTLPDGTHQVVRGFVRTSSSTHQQSPNTQTARLEALGQACAEQSAVDASGRLDVDAEQVADRVDLQRGSPVSPCAELDADGAAASVSTPSDGSQELAHQRVEGGERLSGSNRG